MSTAAIFYDLETSDRNPIGQILNYCFLLVDQNLSVIDECAGIVRISRLQLPSPGAILANRINVVQHQLEARDSEREALMKIARFIERSSSAAGGSKLPVVGFNSSRFDLNYLRTNMIRNGLNPYFRGMIAPRDLLFVARKLSMTHAKFPRTTSTRGEPGKLSLTLENLSHQFKLLTGVQAHESRADVELTINAARYCMENFGVDVRTYEAYEAVKFHRSPRSGEVALRIDPEYDLQKSVPFVTRPMTLLDARGTSALWVDLAQFREGRGRDAIRWFNGAKDSFYLADPTVTLEEPAGWQDAAQSALAEFQKINLGNFFPGTTCDIEQDIYRLDFDDIEKLHRAIWEGQENAVSAGAQREAKKDLRVVYQRYKLNNYVMGGAHDAAFIEKLRAYALYRYGGELNLWKGEHGNASDPGADPSHFHQNLNELLAEAEARRVGGSTEDLALLDALSEFYLTSDIYRFAGEELKLRPPRAPLADPARQRAAS